MVLQRISKRIPLRVRRALYVLLNPQAMIEKQFVFAWHDSESRQVQWHLVDYQTYAKEGYSMNALANMAIKYKMDSLALAPLRAYGGDVDSPDVLPPDNPLAMLVDRPNDYQSWFEFISYCDMYYNIDGNCFIYMQPQTGRNKIGTLPQSLTPLRPDRVLIKPINQGEVMYLYVPEGRTWQTGIPIPAEQMMHIKTPNPYDPLEGMGYGLPGLMPVSKDVDMDNMITSFLFNIFSHQGVMPGGFIEFPYEADEDDIAQLRQQFMDSEGGSENWGRPVVTTAGATYRPSAYTLDQLNVEMLDKRQIKRVLGIFGVPAKLLGLDDEGSTFSNVAESREEFWTRTMLAEMKIFEDEFAYRLREEGQDWFVKFDTSDVPALQQDLMEASTIYMNLVQYGVPPNEAAKRANLNIPMIEGGDIPLISSNLVPLKQALEPPPPPPAPFGGNPDNNPDANNPDSESDNTVEDVPVSEEDANKRKKKDIIHRWGFEQKQIIYKSLDEVTESFEPEFATRATVAFRHDQTEIMKIIRDAKAVINWPVARRGINLYLSTESPTMWRSTFAPAVIELTNAQTERWIERAPDIFPAGTFSLRNVEGEAWFNTYLLQFATAVNETTQNDIHRIIADGISAGLSNDKIAAAIEKLFDQYIKGDVDPETYAFLEDRMPAYRREMIARTETHGAMSAGNHALYKQAGIQRREWLATSDGRTRDTHMVAWQKYSEGGTPGPITFQQYFIVGGHHMMHPGDKSAPLSEWINCRCTELPFIE